MEEVYLVQYSFFSQYSADTKNLTKASYRVGSVFFSLFSFWALFASFSHIFGVLAGVIGVLVTLLSILVMSVGGVQRLGRARIRRFLPRGGHQNSTFRG